MPSSMSANCSSGSKRRLVKPASCRSRQKSFRGFAKCAPSAADTRPGLMPQNTTASPGASTSGTSLGVSRGGTEPAHMRVIVPANVQEGAPCPLGDVPTGALRDLAPARADEPRLALGGFGLDPVVEPL